MGRDLDRKATREQPRAMTRIPRTLFDARVVSIAIAIVVGGAVLAILFPWLQLPLMVLFLSASVIAGVLAVVKTFTGGW